MTSPNIDPHTPDTEVIAVPEPAPVFVDSTGRRSRLLRRLALAFGFVLLGYVGLIGVSLAGGPISSSAVLPLPGLDDDPEPESTPAPAPEPTPSVTPPARRTVESAARAPVQRRPVTVSATSRKASATPSRTPTPKPSASRSPSPAATRPLESASVSRTPEPSLSSAAPEPTVTGAAP